MTLPYAVGVYDCAGAYPDGGYFTTLAEAIAAAINAERTYPRKIVQIANVDACDVDHDGITDDERETIEIALQAARAEVEPFCACGRRISECDRSRKACSTTDRVRP